jgi:hypothetical protein
MDQPTQEAGLKLAQLRRAGPLGFAQAAQQCAGRATARVFERGEQDASDELAVEIHEIAQCLTNLRERLVWKLLRMRGEN